MIKKKSLFVENFLVCGQLTWFKNIGWSRISFIDMGQGSCCWLDVVKHRVIE